VTTAVDDPQDDAKEALAAATKLLKAKQYVEARTEASRCIKLMPDNADCQLVMGVSYANENEWDKATPYYKRFLELAPDHKLAPRIRESLKQLGK
jgi:Tfp pilus assembly protein PilF